MLETAMNYRFTDLVDIDDFHEMLTSLHQATGILHWLVDAENNVISSIGWQEACADFHRTNPFGNQRCEESSRCLAQELGGEGFVGGMCSNGLMDYATPIIIEGKQMATLYFGQVLHEPPDMDFFRCQARECGFEEEAYLEAIRKVPVIPRERVKPIMAFFSQLAQMLARSGLDRMREYETEQQLAKFNQDLSQRVKERTKELVEKNRQLATDIAKRRQAEVALRDSRAQLQAILDSSPIGIGWSRHGKVEYVNRKFTELFGYRLEEIPTLKRLNQLAFPDETVRKEVVNRWSVEVMAAKHAGIAAPVLEAPVVCKDGTLRYGMISVTWVGGRRLVNFSDITDRWQADQRNHARNTILELIATGASLTLILNALVRSVEVEDNAMLCSILLLDEDGEHLRVGAAPSLPEFYNQAIDGLAIGEGVGSCGTSAYTRQRVVVVDIQTHPHWAAFRDLAARAGLAACWSEPIFSSKGRLLGTFAIYNKAPMAPSEDNLTLIGQAANLASIAIEHHQVLDELEHQAFTDSLTGLANRRNFMDSAEIELARARRFGNTNAVLLLDIDHFKAVNDKYGHKAGDTALEALADTLRNRLREVDIIGRIGGEEFAVLLPETDMKMASQAAERLRQAVEEREITVGNNLPLHLTVSIGIASPAKPSEKIEEILRLADSALYAAKNSGRNCVCLAGED
jgi:diguanylate cyclase (GGDEF)-like protein/PAS domain S-box-containing protein